MGLALKEHDFLNFVYFWDSLRLGSGIREKKSLFCAQKNKRRSAHLTKAPIDCQERRAIVLPQPPIELRR